MVSESVKEDVTSVSLPHSLTVAVAGPVYEYVE